MRDDNATLHESLCLTSLTCGFVIGTELIFVRRAPRSYHSSRPASGRMSKGVNRPILAEQERSVAAADEEEARLREELEEDPEDALAKIGLEVGDVCLAWGLNAGTRRQFKARRLPAPTPGPEPTPPTRALSRSPSPRRWATAAST